MEEEKSLETTAESVEKTETTEAKKEEAKTFTRDELNKIVSTEKEKALKDFQAKVEAEKTEAEKLAKMDKEAKEKYEREKLQKELEEYKKKENARNLKDEAIKIIAQKDIPISYLELINFENMDADKVKLAIDSIEQLRNKDRENYLNNVLKQKTPTQKQTTEVETEDAYLKGFDSI